MIVKTQTILLATTYKRMLIHNIFVFLLLALWKASVYCQTAKKDYTSSLTWNMIEQDGYQFHGTRLSIAQAQRLCYPDGPINDAGNSSYVGYKCTDTFRHLAENYDFYSFNYQNKCTLNFNSGGPKGWRNQSLAFNTYDIYGYCRGKIVTLVYMCGEYAEKKTDLNDYTVVYPQSLFYIDSLPLHFAHQYPLFNSYLLMRDGAIRHSDPRAGFEHMETFTTGMVEYTYQKYREDICAATIKHNQGCPNTPDMVLPCYDNNNNIVPDRCVLVQEICTKNNTNVGMYSSRGRYDNMTVGPERVVFGGCAGTKNIKVIAGCSNKRMCPQHWFKCPDLPESQGPAYCGSPGLICPHDDDIESREKETIALPYFQWGCAYHPEEIDYEMRPAQIALKYEIIKKIRTHVCKGDIMCHHVVRWYCSGFPDQKTKLTKCYFVGKLSKRQLYFIDFQVRYATNYTCRGYHGSQDVFHGDNRAQQEYRVMQCRGISHGEESDTFCTSDLKGRVSANTAVEDRIRKKDPNKYCPPVAFYCNDRQSGYICIPLDRMCNGILDCGYEGDALDEEPNINCSTVERFKACPVEGWHRCGKDRINTKNYPDDGQCIPPEWIADGNPDCADGSDEDNILYDESRKCITGYRK